MSAWNVCLDKTYFCSCSDSTDWLRKKLIVFVSQTRDVVVAWQFVLTFGVLSVVVIIMLRLCNTTYNNGEYTTHFPNEPELVYKIRENSINDRFKSADLPSTLSTCQGHLYICRDVVGTCAQQVNVQNTSWWNPKPTQTYAWFGFGVRISRWRYRWSVPNLQICLQCCFLSPEVYL